MDKRSASGIDHGWYINAEGERVSVPREDTTTDKEELRVINEYPNKIKTTAKDNEEKAKRRAGKKVNVFEQLEDTMVALQRGNPEALIEYWRDGPGHDRIGWGNPEEGDLTRCHDLISKYIPSEDAWGFCQNRKMELTGKPNPRNDEE